MRQFRAKFVGKGTFDLEYKEESCNYPARAQRVPGGQWVTPSRPPPDPLVPAVRQLAIEPIMGVRAGHAWTLTTNSC
eukprot:3016908-Pyramimonas_sp.AAC.1